MTGTSQATAFVSGVAALILAHNKEFNFAQVKKQIIGTADEIPGLRDKTSSSGKLNSYAALAIQPYDSRDGHFRHGIGFSRKRGIVGGEHTGAPMMEPSSNLSALMKVINRPIAGVTAPASRSGHSKRAAAQAL